MLHRSRWLPGWPLLLAVVLAAFLAACAGGGRAPATKEPITVGVLYDGGGPVSNITVPARQAMEDYFELVNRRGGVDGHPIRAFYCDHNYEVPRGVDCYERAKREGALIFVPYATPIAEALTPRSAADRIPGINIGSFGASANGERFPYGFFSLGASYYSQAAAAVKVVLDMWEKEGRPGSPRIAYLHLDNPGGRDPLDLLARLSQREGFELRTFAVPLPGIDVTAQMVDIVQRYRADYIIVGAFARMPVATIRAAKDLGFPLTKIVFLTFGIGDAHVRAIGSWDQVQGFQGVAAWGFGQDLLILKEIREMYQAEGRNPPELMASANFEYCFGLATAAIMVEALRQAMKHSGWPLDGEKVKRGLESINGELAGVIRLRTSPQDHEGGGYVRLQRVEGDRFVPATDWFNAYREVVEEVAGIRR